MTRVGIIGIGHGQFGRRSDATVQELAFEAFRDAMKDAGGSVPEYHKQRSLPGVVQEYLGLNPLPTWLTEVACASGSAAIRTAWMGIKAGVHSVVAVIGCQKMTELSTLEQMDQETQGKIADDEGRREANQQNLWIDAAAA